MVLAFVAMFSCSRQPAGPPPEEDILYRVECFYQTNLDSARRILDTLNISAFSEKERAHYCLLRLDALFDTMFYNAEIDSLLQVAEMRLRNFFWIFRSALLFICQGPHRLSRRCLRRFLHSVSTARYLY